MFSPSQLIIENGHPNVNSTKLVLDAKMDISILFNNPINSDVIVEVIDSERGAQAESRCFYAHKCILAGVSPVFSQMLSSEMKAENDGRILIHSKFETVEEFLRIIYTGKIQNLEDHLISFLIFVYTYEVESCKNICIPFVIKSITEYNYVDVFKLGDALEIQEITDAVEVFFNENKNFMVKESVYLENLCKSCPNLIFNVIKREKLTNKLNY